MDYFNKYKKYIVTFVHLLDANKTQKLNLFFESLINDAMPKGFIGEGGEEQLWLRHVLDSILILQKDVLIREFEEAETVVDLGAGAGLPGIPLAIIFPHKPFVLVEAVRKRFEFSREIIERLNLDNISLLNKRVEDVKPGEIIGTRILVLFRAFLKPLVSLELALCILSRPNIDRYHNISNKDLPGTKFAKSKVLYWRSNRFDIPQDKILQDQVIVRLRELGYSVPDFISLECPIEMNSRGIYAIEYLGDTAVKYPRSWKRIKKDKLANELIK